MKLVQLYKGNPAVVDDADFELVNQYRWYTSMAGYATRVSNGKRIWMHRLINDTPRGYITDHINGNKLDNRRENLRTVTSTQNLYNNSAIKKTSKYKGVSWNTWAKAWKVTICSEGIRQFLGYFKIEEDAAKKYDQAVKQLFGQYAKLNF